jgi:hypothetical protein
MKQFKYEKPKLMLVDGVFSVAVNCQLTGSNAEGCWGTGTVATGNNCEKGVTASTTCSTGNNNTGGCLATGDIATFCSGGGNTN